MSLATPDLKDTLEELIDLTREAEWVYSNTAQDGRDSVLVAFAMKRAELCRTRAEDLASIAGLYGRDPDRSDSMRGLAHRTWTQLRNAVGVHDDLHLFDGCERIEDEMLRAYSRLLRHVVPASLRIALQGELDKSLVLREELRELGTRVFSRDSGKARAA